MSVVDGGPVNYAYKYVVGRLVGRLNHAWAATFAEDTLWFVRDWRAAEGWTFAGTVAAWFVFAVGLWAIGTAFRRADRRIGLSAWWRVGSAALLWTASVMPIACFVEHHVHPPAVGMLWNAAWVLFSCGVIKLAFAGLGPPRRAKEL